MDDSFCNCEETKKRILCRRREWWGGGGGGGGVVGKPSVSQTKKKNTHKVIMVTLQPKMIMSWNIFVKPDFFKFYFQVSLQVNMLHYTTTKHLFLNSLAATSHLD